MNIIIIGYGRVGASLASLLSDGNDSVVVIDNDPAVVAGVDPERKTVTVIEQCGWGIDSQTKTSWRVDKVYSFSSLHSNYYIPIRPSGLTD